MRSDVCVSTMAGTMTVGCAVCDCEIQLFGASCIHATRDMLHMFDAFIIIMAVTMFVHGDSCGTQHGGQPMSAHRDNDR